jgi:hypothetical protein
MNIVAYKNQKTYIFLSEERNFVLATLVSNNNVVGVRKITQVQAEGLLKNRQALEAQHIFIVLKTEEAVALLESAKVQETHIEGSAIPSPYVLDFFFEELFLSTQKTRGPNKLN